MAKIGFVFVCLMVCVSSLFGQISSDTDEFMEAAPYSGTFDMVYYFKTSSEISFKALAPSGQTADYLWRKYNSNDGSWSIVGTTNELTGISEGCYEVTITSNGGDTKYRAWALVPELLGGAEAKEVEHTCVQLTLLADGVTSKPLTVVNPDNGTDYPISYGMVYQWFADDVKVVTDNSKAQVSINAPYEDTEYNVEVTCRFEFITKIESGSLSIVAKAVKAYFKHIIDKPEYKNEDHKEEDGSETEGSAPLNVQFFAKPVNDNDTAKYSLGPIQYYEYDRAGAVETQPNFTYPFQQEGKYVVTLKVTSFFGGCTDISEAVTFTVTDLLLDAPNFFTPTGDDIHDEFKVSYRSVKEFKMVIINRWGRVVYSSTNAGEGWNGKINGKDAAPGVYFYDATAIGFNKESKHIKGFLHLIRTEK